MRSKTQSHSKENGDSRGSHVRVLLLAVTSLALEGDGEGLAVDEHVAGDDTHRDALSEDVEESSLACATLAHDCSEKNVSDAPRAKEEKVGTHERSSCRERRSQRHR